jgi:hypothetical protein
MKRKYKKPTIKTMGIEEENVLDDSLGQNNAKGYKQLSKGSDFDSEEDGPDTPTDPDVWE